jgi:hypothetical protein
MRVGLQIKFQDNGNIKNQILIIDKPGFRVPSLTYEKVFKRGELDVVEYYCNGRLDHYFEKETKPGLRIERGYSGDRIPFATNVVYFDSNNRPIIIYQEVEDMDGTLNKGYRYIDQNGYQSWDGFDDFESCYIEYMTTQIKLH